jgi:lysozyme
MASLSDEAPVPRELLAQLRRDEGFRSKPYRDSVGKLTIGYGRNLDDRGISRAEAEMMLVSDVLELIAWLDRELPWWRQLGEPRQWVLVAMAYNLGPAGLLGFRRALEAMQAGDWETAAREMLDSRWAQQVGPRAHRLAQQMREGIWT